MYHGGRGGVFSGGSKGDLGEGGDFGGGCGENKVDLDKKNGLYY